MKKEKPKALLVQPHSDDILLSCSDILFRHEDYSEIVILTIENNPKRIEEDKRLKEFFPVEIITIDNDYQDKSHKAYFKNCSSIEPEAVLGFLRTEIGVERMKKMRFDIRNIVNSYVKKNFVIYTCLGVGHPFHWYVHELTKEFSNFFYREWPHSYKKRNKFQLEKLKSQFDKVKICDNKENHDVKFVIAKEIYKTQSSVFFFEQGKIKANYPEEFYISNNLPF